LEGKKVRSHKKSESKVNAPLEVKRPGTLEKGRKVLGAPHRGLKGYKPCKPDHIETNKKLQENFKREILGVDKVGEKKKIPKIGGDRERKERSFSNMTARRPNGKSTKMVGEED